MSDSPIVYVKDGITYYRASSLTMCPRAFIFARQGHPRRVPANLQTAFDQGHEWEPKVLDMLRKRGYDIYDEQRRIDIRLNDTLQIVGHIDALSEKFKAAPIPTTVIEVKALNHENTEKFLEDPKKHFPYYMFQATCYLIGTKADRIIFAIYDKDEGQLWELSFNGLELVVEFDPMVPIVQRELDWHNFQLSDTWPNCLTTQFCPYYYLHEDELIDDPILEADCATLTTIRSRLESLEKLSKIISTRIKDRLTGSEVKKGRTGNYKFAFSTVRSRRLKTRELNAYLKSQSLYDEYSTETTTTRLTVEKVDNEQ